MKKHKLSLLSPQLEAFMVVALHKSMHAGARAIYLSQTAVTQRIQVLESRLGTTLFVRTRHGVQLTTEGEALLRYCQTIADLGGETFARIAGAATTSVIRLNITGPTSIMESRIIPQCLPVMKDFPELLLTFDINDTDQGIQSLRRGESQLAIIKPEMTSKEMEIKTLKPEKYQLLCTSAWKNRNLQDILQTERIIDFDEHDPTSFNYLKQFKLFKYAQLNRLFVNRTPSLATMLEKGYGYGVLTEEFSHPYLRRNSLIALNQGKTYKNPLVLAWYSRPQAPDYFLSIIKAII